MNSPAKYNFPNHYKNDGLRNIRLRLNYASGNPVILTACQVKIQIRDSYGKLAFTFSTEPGFDALLTLEEPNVVLFSQINSWDLPNAIYDYDVQVTHVSGLVLTYIYGKWKINQDITL